MYARNEGDTITHHTQAAGVAARKESDVAGVTQHGEEFPWDLEEEEWEEYGYDDHSWSLPPAIYIKGCLLGGLAQLKLAAADRSLLTLLQEVGLQPKVSHGRVSCVQSLMYYQCNRHVGWLYACSGVMYAMNGYSL
jgi:hypothetical protein